MTTNTDKQVWYYTSEFIEIDYPLDEPYDYVEIRPVEIDHGHIFIDVVEGDLYDLNHEGTDESVIAAIHEVFGVTVKMRPDLGMIVAEVVSGV